MLKYPKISRGLTLPQHKKRTQRLVNKYVRLRDIEKPCISCNQMVRKKEAGHFIAQGSSGLFRYDYENIHGQCMPCNRYKHGNLLEYRINLVKKIGQAKVEYLENNRHVTKKWTREELLEIEYITKTLIKKIQ